MSFVTNVILTCSLMEKAGDDGVFPPVDHLNAWLTETYRCTLVEVSAHAGGTKVMEAPVFLCAFNYLDEPEFLRHVASAPWDDPESVRVFLCRQEESAFDLVSLTPTA